MPVRLVIADDNDAYRAGMVRAAAQHPDVDLVAEADGGVAALEAIVQHHPDVALVDLRMPVVDGLDVMRRLAHVEPRVGSLVVILSAATEAGVRAEALEHGAIDFLTKDLPRKDILARVVEIATRGARGAGAEHAF